jgi:multidrug efflux system outer membrane protein
VLPSTCGHQPGHADDVTLTKRHWPCHRKTGEQRAQQEQLVATLREAARLSTDRYQGGLDSYLQVLDAQRSLFRSELDLVTLQRQELATVVELFRALGGGWTSQP